MADIKKFLNQEGVSHLWTKVTEKIAADVAAEAALARAAEEANAKAAAAAQKTADDLATLVGTIPVGEDGNAVAATVVAYIDKKTDGIATDAALSELQGKVNTIESDYLKAADKTELNSAIEAEAARAAAAEKVNADAIAAVDAALKLAVENNTEGMDSIKELATWINEHGTDAAAYAQAIAALEGKTVLGTDAEGEEYATVKAYVEAIEAAVKSYADGVANTAETNAKGYADGLASNYDAAGSAAAAETAAKAYADGLAGNYDAAGTAATAEQNAKDYTDAEIAKIQGLSNEDIDAAIAAAVNSTSVLGNGVVGNMVVGN